MSRVKDEAKTVRISFLKVYRPIFVAFFLYLLRDVIWRWDGVRFYAPFSGFLPSVALVSIPWAILSLLTTLIVWLLLRGVQGFCLRRGWKFEVEILFMFIIIMVFLTAMLWIGKRLITSEPLSFTLKAVLFFCLIFGTAYLTWVFRRKTNIFLDSITPLVWIFGIWALVSVSIVTYHTWWKQTDNVVSQKISSQTSKAEGNRPNIILVIFDTLTARDMSLYGYHRDTTPFINKWAEKGSVFTRLKAESNFTPPTVSSIMSGKRVWTHRVFQEYSTLPGNDESLPLILKKNGYYNMAFVQNPVASPKALGLDNNFDISPGILELVPCPKRFNS